MHFYRIFVIGVMLSISSFAPTFAKPSSSVEIFSSDQSLRFYDTPNVDQFMKAEQINPQEGFLPYARKADTALYSLIKGRVEDFLFLISTNLIEQYGEQKITDNAKTILIPYFKDFSQFEEEMIVSPIRDRWGNEGYSFKQSFLTTNNETKKLTVQVVIENGTLAISNITPHTK